MATLPLLLLLQVSLAASSLSLLQQRHPEPASILFIPPANGTSPSSSAAATIPAFPEQSDVSGGACPLDPPADLLPSVSSACSASVSGGGGPPSRSSCCPALHAWLLAAYSATALASRPLPSSLPDFPALPDDSESCIGGVERALRHRGVELPRVNATCDAAYCFCGIRLRRLACAGAFVADAGEGRWVPTKDARRRLEKDCSRPGFGGCTRCLRTLNQLKVKEKQISSRSNKDGDAGSHGRECQLMGLTWLLSKNRTLFWPAATSVLHSITAAAGPDPNTCSLTVDDIPIAVGSDQINSDHGGGPIAVRPASLFLRLSPLLLLALIRA
ncbi:uncharacterized GPI-anchored protein At4g28100-like [Zingiber officinale]|uniref:SPARK domain-containing protein n=1 Tax=Zingiber officinale TaxID=94328 RepID=A0A8J5GBL5_ZINOF|nr:uncharacterized GPI-anchored protein At4g28100-like [Zingiber officinale]KAG6505038.1 hypothetical protein ZIOFF_037386 [Zingiber officinale]